MAESSAVREIEHRGLRSPFQLQHRADDRLEQMLVVQHRDDREEHDEQRRERQRRLERLAEPLFIGHAGERGRQHDHEQADEPDFGQVQAERDDQDDGSDRLHDQHARPRAACACGSARDRIRRAPGARWPASSCRSRTSAASRRARRSARPATSTGSDTGATCRKNSTKIQSACFAISRFCGSPDLRHDAAERRADRRVHHQAAQERAKRIEIGAMQLVHLVVVTDVVLDVVAACRTRSDGTPGRSRRPP